MKKSKGFTLAEILIAMTVLGIIVAASVPVILNMRPNKNAIMMKKAYYATETIISSLINDAKYYPETEDSTQEGFKNNKSVTIEGTTPSSINKLKCLFANQLNIKQDIASVCNGTITAVTTMDGIYWDLTGLSNSGNNTIRIDVDGQSKGINTFYTATIPANCTGDNAKYCWSGSVSASNTDKTKKEFDSAVILIDHLGKLSADCSQQTEFCEILSGHTKLFKGDND